MEQKTIFLTILGMSVVTYLPRLLPAWFLSTRELPPRLASWLSFVPPAVIAAMLLPWLTVANERLHLSASNLFLLAALPTLACAVKTRSFLGTMLVGVALVAGARLALSLVA